MSLTTLRTYTNPVDAELARLRLEGEGIDAFLVDEHVISIQWLYSDAIGGVKVRVRAADLGAAREALAAAHDDALADVPESRAAPADGDLCPVCGSDRVRSSSAQRRAAALSLVTSLPLVFWRRCWVCAACGHAWRPTRTPSAVPEETRLAEHEVAERRRYPLLRGLIATLIGLGILWYVEVQIRGR